MPVQIFTVFSEIMQLTEFRVCGGDEGRYFGLRADLLFPRGKRRQKHAKGERDPFEWVPFPLGTPNPPQRPKVG